MANYQALKTELQNASYSGMTDAQAAATINAKTIAAARPALLEPTKIVNAIVATDLASLTATQLSVLNILLSGTLIDGSPGTTVRLGFQTLFAGKTQTLSNLGALVAPFDNATVTWASVNFGPSTVSDLDVAAARAL